MAKSKKGIKNDPYNGKNPFNMHFNRRKYDVIGGRKKGDVGHPVHSRTKALRWREKTLLNEYKNMHKKNVYIDRRIGEKNHNLDPQQKSILRAIAEKKKQFSKKSLYNLNEEEVLTHKGLPLTDDNINDDDFFSDNEDDGGNADGALDGEYVKAHHFSGGLFEKHTDEGGRKTRKELIEEIIAESKKKKADSKQEKEEQREAVDEIDAKYKSFNQTISSHLITDDDKKMDKKNADYMEYRQLIGELTLERSGKAMPSSRLKTTEEIEQDEQKERRKYEERRAELSRVPGPPTNSGQSADALDSSYYVTFGKANDKFHNKKKKKDDHQEDSDSEEDDEVVDENSEVEQEDEENFEVEQDIESEVEEEESEFEQADEENFEVEKEEESEVEQEDEENFEVESEVEEEESEVEQEDEENLEVGQEDEENFEVEQEEESEVEEEESEVEQEDEENFEVEQEVESEVEEEESEVEQDDEENFEVEQEEESEVEQDDEENFEVEEDSDVQQQEVENFEVEHDAEAEEEIDQDSESEVEYEDVEKEFSDGGELEETEDVDIDSEESQQEEEEPELYVNRGKKENEIKIRPEQNTNLKCKVKELAKKGAKVTFSDLDAIESPANTTAASIYDVPKSYKSFWNLLKDKTPSDVSYFIEKIIEINHPSLGGAKKAECNSLFVYLLKALQDLTAVDAEGLHFELHPLKYIDAIIPHLHTLVRLSPSASATAFTDVIGQKYMEYNSKSVKEYPKLDTFIFLKIAGLLFPASDYLHEVMTQVMTFLTQMLGQVKPNSRRDISAMLFASFTLIGYLRRSERFIGEVSNALKAILYMTVQTSLLKVKLPHSQPFRRIGPKADLLVLENIVSSSNDLPSLTLKCLNDTNLPLTNEFKVKAVHESLSLLVSLCGIWRHLPAVRIIFESVSTLMVALPRDKYPEYVHELLDSLSKAIRELPTVGPRLVRERGRPRPLNTFTPTIEAVIDGEKKRSGTKEQLDLQKLRHKVKRERKAVRRELRRDQACLANQQFKEMEMRDDSRKAKLKRIRSELAEQEGDYKKLKR